MKPQKSTLRPIFCRLCQMQNQCSFSWKFLWSKPFAQRNVKNMKLASLQDCGAISG
jgi:hypothetical protein